MSDKKLWRNLARHSHNCTWDGRSQNTTMGVGRCRACDEIKSVRATGSIKGIYGIDKKDMDKFCKSNIPWEKCTKHTNPSCACNKLVLCKQL